MASGVGDERGDRMSLRKEGEDSSSTDRDLTYFKASPF